ncbi:MAG: hypothetical protein JWP57_3348, partial [Spirosoma sp.]|nr:hypothetical protein [Spirosoma sp.]
EMQVVGVAAECLDKVRSQWEFPVQVTGDVQVLNSLLVGHTTAGRQIAKHVVLRNLIVGLQAGIGLRFCGTKLPRKPLNG